MEAVRRRVSSEKEYDHLFPPPKGNDITIKKSADVGDTVGFIQEQVPKTLSQTKQIAAHLMGESLDETCSKIWHFVYKHIPYKRDEDGVEQVRSPRRTWHDRNKVDANGKVGVDCDCYTVFISSILMNLKIPHEYRITKYPKKKGEIPRWQHIYIVVPKEKKLKQELKNREEYITMDCVKDAYDEEEEYLEKKDYNATMRLDYLDGLDGEEEFEVPNSMDARDIASLYDEEDLGKIGQWVKKAVKNTGQAVKKVANTAGKVVRTVNKVANPATILLRNGFLAAMKINLKNVAGRLRFAYLTDEQAKAMDVDPTELAKLRKIRDKAEIVYWQAGGEKTNLKKAILSGKGNNDKKVALSGFHGFGEIYADQEEYDILHGLGEPATATAIAAATSAVVVIAKALDQVKDLIKPKTAAPAETSPPTEFYQEPIAEEIESPVQGEVMPVAPPPVAPPPINARIGMTKPATKLPVSPPVNTEITAREINTGNNTEDPSEKKGFFAKTGTWIKEHPTATALIGAALLTGGYLIYKSNKGQAKKKTGNLNGIPKKKTKSKSKSSKGKIIKLKAVRIR